MSLPLVIKYRPKSFEEVIGHEDMLMALLRAISSDTCPHSFLFTGVSGLGKTTLARITAMELQADPLEIDAASNNGVDATRGLVELGQHMSMVGDGRRAIIIDECHTLSKQAWQPLLKLLEEPPDHLYIMLCTTELEKVPDTIRNRCFHVVLKPLHQNDISDLITLVSELEGWTVDKDVHAAIVQAATGQPRKALSMLDVAHDAPSRDEVYRICALMDTSEPVMDLCRLLVDGNRNWKRISETLANIADDEYESVGNAVARYIITVMLRSEEAKAAKLWKMLDALTFPTAGFDRKAAFYTAVGRIVFGE